jgi:uncharacterized membrane protein YeaQ/YmgE (transglycosylase-associated protein family)
MNVMMWLLAAALAGSIACSLLNLGVASGVFIAAIIGIVGVSFGGPALGPAIGGGYRSGMLSPFAVLVVSVSAIGCLKLAHVLYVASRSRLNDEEKVYKPV